MPEPLGPSSATNSPGSISRLTSSSARTVVGPRWKYRATPVSSYRLIPTCLNASAGRSRAARRAPAVPAISPPRRANPKPIARTVIPTGAVSDTLRVAVRTVLTPRFAKSLPVVELAVSDGPNASTASATATPRPMPKMPPRMPCRERLARDLADDHPLRPAERLQCAELADALADRREREQRGEQERGGGGDDREREPEIVREIRRVDERAADRVGDVLRACDLRLRQRLLGSPASPSRRHSTTSRARGRRSRGSSRSRASAVA